MKKFFAAFLAISITAALAGCNKSADEQTAEETFSETISETIANTEETSAEAVSETEETTAKGEVKNTYSRPVNSKGQTYAAIGDGPISEEDCPDLIEAQGNARKNGYISKIDYFARHNDTLYENYDTYTVVITDESTLEWQRELQKDKRDDYETLNFYKVCYDVPMYNYDGNPIDDVVTLIAGYYILDNETESNDEPRLAQHEDLIGCWRNSEYQTTFIFEENRYIGLDKGWGEIVDDTVKDGILSFSDNKWGLSSNLTATIFGDKLFVEEKEDDGETYLYEFERYTQPAMSLQDFNGDMSIGYYCGGPDGDLFDFENGKGKFLPSGKMRSELDAITDAEIILHEDKVTLTVGDDTGDYKYYTLENTATYVRFIFLIDDKKIIDLIQFI